MSAKERLRAALAEVGYPNARIYGRSDDPSVLMAPSDEGVPEDALWMAFFVVGLEPACWPCWSSDNGESCTHDPRMEERPSLARR